MTIVTANAPAFDARATLAFLIGHAGALGRGVLLHAAKLYFAAIAPTTPVKAKAVIYAALAYLGLPLDAIPDFVPVLGFSDDVTVMLTALAAVHLSITPDVVRRAEEFVDNLLRR